MRYQDFREPDELLTIRRRDITARRSTPRSLERLLQGDPGGPVVMPNLLRFAEGGRESCDEYARHLRETFLPRYGAEVLNAGTGSTALVAEDGQSWDAVLLVRYPDRAAFSRMVADPEYQQVTRLRTQALTEAVLQATTPSTGAFGPG